jgi:predicted esterase YcpF (UPF0227 family)
MLRILFLHGLESSNECPKVDFLKSVSNCYAPKIDYTRTDLENNLFDVVEQFSPNVIIGSSLGGYVASLLSSYFNIECIAFNPAIHSRPFDPMLNKLTSYSGNTNVRQIFVLGIDDDTVDPNITKELSKNMSHVEIEEVEGLGHRIPVEILKNIYNKYLA